MNVDVDARKELAEALRHLVTGQITNDDFDDRYADFEHSSDPAIRSIAQFGWSLYSDTHKYRLRGSLAPSNETKSVAARAILFLQTRLEYEWPPGFGGVVPFFCLFGPGFWLVVGAIFLVVAGCNEGLEAVVMGLFGLALLAYPVHWLATFRERLSAHRRFLAAGDFEVWPFLRTRDFEEAKRHPQFLAGEPP